MWVNKVTLLTKWEEKMRKNCCDLGHALTMDQKDLGSSVVFLLVIWLFSKYFRFVLKILDGDSPCGRSVAKIQSVCDKFFILY